MNTPPALGSASHLIENYPDEFLITLVETGVIDASIEYTEGDTRDGLRSCIESMKSTIETGDDVDTTIVEEVILYAAAMFTLKHRGYETHTEDGTIFVTDEDGDVVYEEPYRSE
jgi:hypothetical protein